MSPWSSPRMRGLGPLAPCPNLAGGKPGRLCAPSIGPFPARRGPSPQSLPRTTPAPRRAKWLTGPIVRRAMAWMAVHLPTLDFQCIRASRTSVRPAFSNGPTRSFSGSSRMEFANRECRDSPVFTPMTQFGIWCTMSAASPRSQNPEHAGILHSPIFARRRGEVSAARERKATLTQDSTRAI